MKAAGAPVTAVHVYVNDVPVFGLNGNAAGVRRREQREFSTLDVPLVAGSNKVQIDAHDAAGADSLRELFLVHRSGRDVHPRRFVLAVGIADYDDEDLKAHLRGEGRAGHRRRAHARQRPLPGIEDARPDRQASPAGRYPRRQNVSPTDPAGG